MRGFNHIVIFVIYSIKKQSGREGLIVYLLVKIFETRTVAFTNKLASPRLILAITLLTVCLGRDPAAGSLGM